MNTNQTDTSLFSSLRFILYETSHPGNVGAIARAMKTMGFSNLILVKPRFSDVLLQEEAIAFASGAQEVLTNARIVHSIEEALSDCQFAVAVSARLREFSPPILSPRAFASHVCSDINLQSALVFGSERYGLPNEIVEKCHALVSIPANPEYSSLNIAQALQVLAYECRVAALDSENITGHDSGIGFHGEAASVTQIEGMFSHLEEALTRIEFLNPENPKKLLPRLRRLLARSNLEVEEVNILRGIARQILLKIKS